MEYTTTNDFTDDLNLVIILKYKLSIRMGWCIHFLSGSWVVLGEIDELYNQI